MTSSSVTRSPISGTQPSRLSVSFIPRSEPSGQRRGNGVAEAAPGAERMVHGRGLVAAVDHTVPALVVAALAAVVLPLRGLDQLLERRRVTLLEEVAGPLPAEHVVGRVPPRRALVVALAHEELEEQRRLVELPAALRARQDPREQLVSALPALAPVAAAHPCTGLRHCPAVRALRWICGGYCDLPPPARARLRRKRGSSMSTSG